MILSVCPPHVARNVASAVGEFDGVYVDANAVAPATVREIAAWARALRRRRHRRAAAGESPTQPLSLGRATPPEWRLCFADTKVDARIVSRDVGAASAVKTAYAAWTKGSAALLLAVLRSPSRGRRGALDAECEDDPRPRGPPGERRALGAGQGLALGRRDGGDRRRVRRGPTRPDGFHLAAAEVFRRYERMF